MIDTRVELCGITLPSPLVLASGIWGCCAETLIRLAREGAGAVTTKSCRASSCSTPQASTPAMCSIEPSMPTFDGYVY